MVRALEKLGFDSRLLRHGVKREIFLVPLIRNLQNHMEGTEKRARYIDVSFDGLADYWRDRWLIPRSQRVDGWCNWNPKKLRGYGLLIMTNFASP